MRPEGGEPPLIITSIDSLHPITGIKNKLLSYYQFLKKYGDTYKRKVVMIQYCLPILDNNENILSHVKIIAHARKEIKEIVKKICQEFGPQCILLQEDNPPLEKRLALWSQSDVLLVSSLRDGLCLPLFEYVAAKKHAKKLSQAVMLLSEFSGSNRAFKGFLEYNPFNVSEFLTKLDYALSMSPSEKEELM
jgi:trehalose-6-phosphate synthase